MGFVNESVDSPQRVAELSDLGLVSPIDNRPPVPWRWAVDRERGHYFVSFGGGSFDVPLVFALVVPGGTVWIEGRNEQHGNIFQRTVEIDWTISSVSIPRALASRSAEILALVREALEAHGLGFDPTPVKRVRVAELPRPVFV